MRFVNLVTAPCLHGWNVTPNTFHSHILTVQLIVHSNIAFNSAFLHKSWKVFMDRLSMKCHWSIFFSTIGHWCQESWMSLIFMMARLSQSIKICICVLSECYDYCQQKTSIRTTYRSNSCSFSSWYHTAQKRAQKKVAIKITKTLLCVSLC